MYGEYDHVIDAIFSEDRPTRTSVDDAIAEMEWWACFKNERDDESKDNKFNLDAMLQAMRKEMVQETRVERKTVKVGRNDPCPCGSGKKYKKCCIDLLPNSPTVLPLESKYDLLADYPKDSELFEQLYEQEAIAIDQLVYKALHHRAIPLWVKRDREQERIGKINYLNAALKLFIEKCQREQITSFSVYDERFMVHYRSRDWIRALVELIEEHDSGSLMAIKQSAEEILQKYI